MEATAEKVAREEGEAEALVLLQPVARGEVLLL